MIMQTAIINHTRTYTPVNPIFTRNKVDRWTKPNKKTIPNNYIEQVNIATRNNDMVIHNKYNVLATLTDFKESEDEQPFKCMYKLKKKGKKPYKLTPKTMPSNNMTTTKDYNVVWTDGSAKKTPPKKYKEFESPTNATAFSVFYHKESPLNRGKRCKYATTSLEAELEAIEYTLSKAPTTCDLMIITDCLAAIQFINRNKNDRWGATRRINKLIHKREKTHGSKTLISHILAHTDDKRVQKEKKEKINQYFTIYIDKIGKNINPFQGNIEADKLANEAADTPADWKFDRKRTLLRNPKTLTIKCTHTLTPADIKNTCHNNQEKYWTNRRTKREPNNTEIPEITAITAMDQTPDKHKLYKLQHLALAGKHQCYWNLQAGKCPKWVLAKHQRNYRNPNCEFCPLNQPEDTIHIIGQCPKWERHRRTIRAEINKLFEEYQLQPPERFWLNKKDDYTNCRDKNDEIRHHWINKYKLYASTGRIPHKMLMEMYENEELNDEKWIDIFTKLSHIIITNITNLIKSKRWIRMIEKQTNNEDSDKEPAILPTGIT